MSARVVLTSLATEPIELSSHEQLVADAAGGAAGAVVGFAGAVRNHDGDHPSAVTKLSYSSHPSAPTVLAAVVDEVTRTVDGVRAVAVSHRVGDLDIGDVAFAVAVAADHRAPAFELCARLVDEVKARLPVWKHQLFADGSDEWVGSA
ncbi:molybdenum cofactor biosynthesis protein MoaE [Gordonia aichiensis]|uniref:Molybdopterin synthase large subunit MoaE n=1 Tax=Gordonia aichiensis NBRC 108223 TaxID=1220583 RepID=L7KIN1_9ACTN|nr:molybdenum cofactor biosynthesis protein MoaE [Gordonia aichiensis]GAC48745.1 molybdopterin synthase large subunit MoaE [Gordonia aichiensis NBRC 108223]